MGKKYNTTARTARSIATEELQFLVEAWEGIKPSRQTAIARQGVASAALLTDERATPRKGSEGKRPQVSLRVERTMWRKISVTCAGQHTYTLLSDGQEYELLVSRPGQAPVSEVFTNTSDIKTVLDNYEYGYWASAQHENLAKKVLGDLLVTE
jgi:hypothetical protein